MKNRSVLLLASICLLTTACEHASPPVPSTRIESIPLEARERSAEAIRAYGGRVSGNGFITLSRTDDKRAAAFGDAQMPHIANLTDTHYLVLDATRVTDAGLSYLKDLHELRTLYLVGQNISADGLAHIRRLPKLEKFVLYSWSLTDASLEQIKEMKHLEELALEANTPQLGGVPMSDSGLRHLEALTQLRSLTIRSPHITNEGAAHIWKLTELEELRLNCWPMTDAGLEPVKGLTKLKKLDLGGTKITEAGFRSIQAALPGCEIHR